MQEPSKGSLRKQPSNVRFKIHVLVRKKEDLGGTEWPPEPQRRRRRCLQGFPWS